MPKQFDPHPKKNKALAIFITGLIAGTLDITAACIQYYSKTGKGPGNVLRYIASGVFGKDAGTGGNTMAAWGLLFHYLIAFGLTIFFFWLYPRVNWIRKNIIAAGVLYAIFAWAITTRVIIPLSKIHPAPFDLSKVSIAVAILIVCIGLPIALLTANYYSRKV